MKKNITITIIYRDSYGKPTIDAMTANGAARFFQLGREHGDKVQSRVSETTAFFGNKEPKPARETVFEFSRYGVKFASIVVREIIEKETEKNGFRKTQDRDNGRHMVFEGKSAKGQIVTLEISKIEGNPKDKHFLGSMWAKSGYIKAPIASYWFVSESVLEANGDCHADERYNLTHTDHKVNIEGMKEATEEQLAKILAYATKELNKAPTTTEEAGSFDDLGTLSDKAYKALEKKAKACAMKENPFLRWEWDKQACFISSSDIQGFYFPNYNGALRCIAFRNKRAVAVYDFE